MRRGTEVLATPDWIADPQALRMDGRVVDPDSVTGCRLSWMDFWCQWVASAFWFGDGYVWCPFLDSFGAPKPPMFVLHPHDVTIENGTYWVEDEEIDAVNLLHLRGFEPIIRRSRLRAVRHVRRRRWRYTQTIRDYAAGVFHSGVPAGYLKVLKEGLAQDKADALKARWMDAHGGRNKSIAVLNSTTEFHPLTFTPVDAALIEAMQANLNDLANAAGVPPDMLGRADRFEHVRERGAAPPGLGDVHLPAVDGPDRGGAGRAAAAGHVGAGGPGRVCCARKPPPGTRTTRPAWPGAG